MTIPKSVQRDQKPTERKPIFQFFKYGVSIKGKARLALIDDDTFWGVKNDVTCPKGLNVSLLFNDVSEASGLTVALLVNGTKRDARGVLAAPVMNIVDGNMKGVAFSAVNIVEGVLNGVTIGALNVATSIKGVQLGFVNIVRGASKDIWFADAVKEASEVVQIGLLNIRSDAAHWYQKVIPLFAIRRVKGLGNDQAGV